MTTKKFSDTIEFAPGQVVYEEFIVEGEEPWTTQIDNLNEDLLQVVFPGNLLLDVGWYPEFDRQGQFQVRLIRDEQWDTPIFYAEVAQLELLRLVLEAARQTAAGAALVAA
ncbi:MAG: hypothetical protein KDE53_37380 [Caldilineaceae bacterium]|nr:hypothetical protein [Caldilineaceae bacterium]